MIKNFFKIASRNIRKHKIYSFINFIGLTAGLALALLTIAYVRSELSFDRFHEKADRLYRINYTVPNGMSLATTPPPMAPLLPQFFPGVEEWARIYIRNVSITRDKENNGNSFEETGVLFADSTIMKMFSFTFIAGNPKNALQDPFTALITEEMAKKYFGDNNPLGESLLFGGENPFKVIGVVKDFPENSHLRFHIIVPYDNMYDMESDEGAARMRKNLETNFTISHSYTFVLLKPAYSALQVNENMMAFLDKFCPPNRRIGQVFSLMPITDIHLKSKLNAEPSSTNSMSTIFIFIGAAIMTLLIACINYINLSTAQALTRVKEIAIRRIVGSEKRQLIIQFLAESFIFCLVSMILSYIAFYLLLPLLNQVTNKELAFEKVIDIPLILISIFLLLLITLLAGGYPAYFVLKFNSIAAIKGNGATNLGGQILRKSLVSFQLLVACLLLSGSMLLVKQMDFLTNQPLGFQKEHIITIPLTSQNLNSIFNNADSSYRLRLQTFRDRIESHESVFKSTASSGIPGLGTYYRGVVPEGFTLEDNLYSADMAVDFDFIETYGIEMVAGRSFNKNYGTDEAEAFIVNETAVKEYKWGSPEQAIGKTLVREGRKGKIIGVIKDFNITTLTTAIDPIVLEIDANQWANINVKFKNKDIPSTIEKIKEDWNLLFPEKTFEFVFLDEQLNQQYVDYQNFSKIVQGFAWIAIIISCLGVYGLVMFVVQRKVKEIGVRKVLGASIFNILKIIYIDFLWLLLIGFVLTIPLSYYFINKWFENFTFHTDVDVLTYLLSFAILSLVVSLTIGYHSLKAAMANPVLALRSE